MRCVARFNLTVSLSVGFAAPQHQSFRLLTLKRSVDSAPFNPEKSLQRTSKLDSERGDVGSEKSGIPHSGNSGTPSDSRKS